MDGHPGPEMPPTCLVALTNYHAIVGGTSRNEKTQAPGLKDAAER